jgi:hypothetical protein
MAAKKSAKYPYKWSDGTWHSISESQHKVNVANKGNTTGTPIVPTGTYDPGLDATLGRTTRGLEDLVGLAPNTDTGEYGGTTGRDIDRAQRDLLRYTSTDPNTPGYYTQDYNTGVARTEQAYGRSLDDLLKQRSREGTDYTNTLGTLQRNYDILGGAQNQGIRKAGVAAGGAIAQAQQKRAANMAVDKAPIDLAHQRAVEDSQTAETRLGEDKTYDLGQLKTNYDRNTGELVISTGRNIFDLGETAQNAIREAGYTAGDIQKAKLAQFQQMYPGQKLSTTGGVTRTTAPTAPLTSAQHQQQLAASAQQSAASAAQQAAVAAARARARRRKAVV